MQKNHISVCICTYKRPELLSNLLEKIQVQKTMDLFTYSVVVVDNDENQTAKTVVQAIQKESNIEIAYYVETKQGISHARNKVIEKAKGDFIAFIDDDEYPDENWLLNLFNACTEFEADGVVGGVTPLFEKTPSDWIKRGNFGFKRWGTTGTILTTGSTSNVLIKKSVAESEKPPFNPDFGLSGGEDSLFFKTLIKKGVVFVASAEAIVYEFVPSSRMDIKYFLKRNLLEGSIAVRVYRLRESFTYRLKWFLKSVIGILAYSMLLPVLFLFGRHLVIKYLFKIFYFGGVFFEFIHLSPVYKRSSLF